MVAVLMLPIVLLVAACLLDRLERRMVVDPPASRTPVARPGERAGPSARDEPLAPVLALRRGPSIDGDTLRLPRAS